MASRTLSGGPTKLREADTERKLVLDKDAEGFKEGAKAAKDAFGKFREILTEQKGNRKQNS